MKIPKQFELGGLTWKVVIVDHLPGAMGTTDNSKAEIHLHKAIPSHVREQVFFHELVHAILFSMGKPADQHDEIFTDGFATFLQQFFKSKK